MAGRRTALVVAVDDYEHPGLRRLRSPAADAEALASVLGDPAVAGFDVQVVRNQPAHEIQARVEDLFADARADDVLLLHFSGHGLKNEAGELFFAATSTRPDRLASTAVPAEFVQRCLRSSASRSIVLLLDCCYGGAFGQGVAVRAAGDVNVFDSFPGGRLGGGRGRAVISASSAMEYAFEGDQLRDDAQPQPSLFTAALVRGLATGEADRDEDGWVSLNELYDYVFDRVRGQNPNQTPSRDIEMQGELYLARSGRRRVRPAPLPGDLQAALEDANPYARLGAVAELQARLLSDNLPVAAGAHEALTAMVATDTRLVADAAAQALRAVQLGVSPSALTFGRLQPGARSAPQRLVLTGPPLARAVTVTVSDPWIRVEEADGGYDVTVVPPGSAAATGSVTLGGAAGAVSVPVTVGAAEQNNEQTDEQTDAPAPGSVPVPVPVPAVPSPASAGDAAAAVTPAPATPPAPAADEARPAAGLTRVVAALAIVVGAALALALMVGGAMDDQPFELLYGLLHPGLLAVAGVFVLRPVTRTLGLGLVAGAGAAATLPAVLVASAIQGHAAARAQLGSAGPAGRGALHPRRSARGRRRGRRPRRRPRPRAAAAPRRAGAGRRRSSRQPRARARCAGLRVRRGQPLPVADPGVPVGCRARTRGPAAGRGRGARSAACCDRVGVGRGRRRLPRAAAPGPDRAGQQLLVQRVRAPPAHAAARARGGGTGQCDDGCHPPSGAGGLSRPADRAPRADVPGGGAENISVA